MSIQNLKDQLPDYARDLKLNLGSLASEPALNEDQKAGVFIASAIASRNPGVIAAIVAEFAPRVSAQTLAAAKAAAAVMAMNNVYYRFTHLVENEEYARLPARLRMNVMANPGTTKENFELWSLAVSAVNGCGKCVSAHERVLRETGMSTERIQAAARIAAVVHAVAVTLETDAAAAQPAVAAAA
ncbi:MAG: carboxymuconolactone decarboxylase family protein [Betaproteobacteria bacterium]|nr:carboxymuconolactone decarboxylase family protein [Betaproteobacteria bacterium]